MGYIDKYVKLRPDDFQLSLWGGDAVLYNLDLRLDIIEKAIQLPIVFQSGHIHELRLHIPWTKLGSDPVVVTINTIECILKLRDTAYKERSSRASSETPGKSASRQKIKKQENPDLPPGIVQCSYMLICVLILMYDYIKFQDQDSDNSFRVKNNSICLPIVDSIIKSILLRLYSKFTANNFSKKRFFPVDVLYTCSFLTLFPVEVLYTCSFFTLFPVEVLYSF